MNITSFMNGDVVDASETMTIVTFAAMLVFTVSYMVKTRWRDDPMGWFILADRAVLTVVLGVLAVQFWWHISSIFDLEVLTLVETGFVFLVALIVVASTVYLFRVQHEVRHARAATPDDRQE